MTDPISLPPGVALAIIAFLLSLLPAGLFIWLWYLRHHERAVPAKAVALAFIGGMAIVLPAFWLERFAEGLWQTLHPATAHYFAGAVLPLVELSDILLPALATFLVVALIEEGLRWGLLRIWYKRSKTVDQVFDGLILGVGAGLGFATLENTLYFLNLFQSGSYNTLVFVFFLRFLISTLAHIGFGGLMGTLIARGTFNIYGHRPYFALSFLIPWALHGLYDLLLGLNQTVYAVLLLLPALFVLFAWSSRREFFTIQRKNGRLLAAEEPAVDKQANVMQQILPSFDSPWNIHAPWLNETRARRALSDKRKKS